MLSCDLHVHTIKSRCGYSTPLEMMNSAADLNLSAIAITDHCSFSGGYISHALFRLPEVYRGVRIFKGVEVTVFEDPQKIGLPFKYLSLFDIILAGFHHTLPGDNSAAQNTQYLIQFLQAHPYIDVISHPAIQSHALDFSLLIPQAVSMGVALEINNKNLKYNKTNLSSLKELVQLTIKHNGRFVFNSDAHTIFELGENEEILSFLESYSLKIPDELIINRTLESSLQFMEERKPLKRKQK